MTISRIASIPLVIAQGTNSQATAINLWNQLRLSTYYNNYAPMYDQMKIDKVRLKITGNQSGSVTANLAPAVVLAFDRNVVLPRVKVRSDRPSPKLMGYRFPDLTLLQNSRYPLLLIMYCLPRSSTRKYRVTG